MLSSSLSKSVSVGCLYLHTLFFFKIFICTLLQNSQKNVLYYLTIILP